MSRKRSKYSETFYRFYEVSCYKGIYENEIRGNNDVPILENKNRKKINFDVEIYGVYIKIKFDMLYISTIEK